MTYTSSIITKYGDTDNVKKDASTISEILSRQGVDLIRDCLAEYVGTTANKYKFSEHDRESIIEVITTELKEALQERL